MDDPFKPLSAKGQKRRSVINGQEIESPGRARWAEERTVMAGIKNKAKCRKRQQDKQKG